MNKKIFNEAIRLIRSGESEFSCLALEQALKNTGLGGRIFEDYRGLCIDDYRKLFGFKGSVDSGGHDLFLRSVEEQFNWSVNEEERIEAAGFRVLLLGFAKEVLT